MIKIKKPILMTLIIVLCVVSYLGIYASESIVKMHSADPAPDGSRFKNTDEGVVAVSLDVKGGKFVGLIIPSWYDPPTSTSIMLYKWDTDYQTTVSKMPIFSDLIEDLSDSGWVNPGEKDFRVNFERAFAEGKYLLVFRKNTDHALHIPTHAAYKDSVAYFNGELYENVSYRVSSIIDSDAELNEEPNVKFYDNEIIVAAYGVGASEDGESFFSVENYESVSHKFTVSGGKFTGFLFHSLFLQSGHAEFEFKIFRWMGSYADTVKENPIYINNFEAVSDGPSDHRDLKIFFERAYAEGDYLVQVICNDSFNLWSHAPKEGVTTYMNDEAYEYGTLKLSYVADKYAALDERPIEANPPTEPETNVPTGDYMQNIIVACVVVALLSVIVRRKTLII